MGQRAITSASPTRTCVLVCDGVCVSDSLSLTLCVPGIVSWDMVRWQEKCRATRRLAESERVLWCARWMPWTACVDAYAVSVGAFAAGLRSPVSADLAGIHFRMLNRSRGPAVWVCWLPAPCRAGELTLYLSSQGPRAQIDRELYRFHMQTIMSHYVRRSACRAASLTLILACVQNNLHILEHGAEDLMLDESGAVKGVLLGDGTAVESAAVVLTNGTFLRGEIHLGEPAAWVGRCVFAVAYRVGCLQVSSAIRLEESETGRPWGCHRRWSDLDSSWGGSAPERRQGWTPAPLTTANVHPNPAMTALCHSRR
jgi:hypothetical protein